MIGLGIRVRITYVKVTMTAHENDTDFKHIIWSTQLVQVHHLSVF